MMNKAMYYNYSLRLKHHAFCNLLEKEGILPVQEGSSPVCEAADLGGGHFCDCYGAKTKSHPTL